MLVQKQNFLEALLALEKERVLAFDTETTILPWWKTAHFRQAGFTPRVFSIQISSEKNDYYFDFDILGETEFAEIAKVLTADPEKLWFAHNAKFDLHHLANHGVQFAGTVHDTLAIARIVNNIEPSMSLDALSQKYLGGQKKLDVKSLLKERGHVSKIKKFGHNDKSIDVLHFDRLTLQELVDYGCQDTKLTLQLGLWQIATLSKIEQETGATVTQVLENERALTKVLWRMERTGVHIDRAYTEEAYENEVKEYRRLESELNGIAGSPTDWNSAKQLKPIFDRLGEPYSYTEKGNASFDRDALEDSTSELAKSILKYRYHYKRAHTYFENFLWLADDDGILHADSQQAGTQFARMSYWDPNLQNIPKRRDKDEAQYKVRKCFRPRPGCILADFDYSGAEFYMTVDYANEARVIEQLKQGLDPHADLAERMALKDRDTAKTMQFRILYGAGYEAVGRSLGHTGPQAKRIGKIKKNEYFDRMPNVASLIRQVSDVAARRGWIRNWLGRVLYYGPDTAYKATNGLIQSGVGDMTKKAMVNIGRQFPDLEMLIQVHDSIVMQLTPQETFYIPEIKRIMREAYPHKRIQMEADAGFSKNSWAELEDAIP